MEHKPLSEIFAQLHNRDIVGAKFKIGDRVRIINVFGGRRYTSSTIYTVSGVNYQDDDQNGKKIIEYSVSGGWNTLFWEDELIEEEGK